MREPNWAPLERVLPLDECAPWMHMGTVVRGSRVIEQYKHYDTRRYLNLDQDGGAWRIAFYWADGNADLTPDVDPVPLAEALEWALSC